VDIDRWMINNKLTFDEDKTEQWLLLFKKELKLLNTRAELFKAGLR